MMNQMKDKMLVSPHTKVDDQSRQDGSTTTDPDEEEKGGPIQQPIDGDPAVTMVSTIGGTAEGGAIGSVGGPVGMLVGMVAGAVAGALGGSRVPDFTTPDAEVSWGEDAFDGKDDTGGPEKAPSNGRPG